MGKIEITNLKEKELEKLSSEMLLSLTSEEMRVVRSYFVSRGREPSHMELEIIAQTWSEHCIHKTMTGVIKYEERSGAAIKKEDIDNLLKQTVFRATKELDKKYCLSVFEDNAGVIELNREYAIAMKVETHNHPSAIEPYGGAATGIGGVIRDILGCGKGARPVLNIDVFCFGFQDIRMEDVPRGVLHPKRVFKGVVKGVRDYGNRMGIPTLSGAIIFNKEYLYNPLVYCGTIGIIPKCSIQKEVKSGDLIVVIGGRTGRDGIHGATFSSVSLNEDTDVSCVQIGDPITEKKFADVLLKLRDLGLYNAITDCGAGGFSSAIGEMGKKTGARVNIDKAVLKYDGLKPWEVYLSESQERMVLSVPPENIDRLTEILESEDVESAVLGEFSGSGKLEVFYGEEKEADLDMNFLHNGVPRIVRKAVWTEKPRKPIALEGLLPPLKNIFKKVVSHPNVASKEVVIRQYDHEVQGGAVGKPLGGVTQDVPYDGCVSRPLLDSYNGIAVGLGINPFYGLDDPYNMALSCCEEAARNAVVCGGLLDGAAFMDNFCWGDTADEKILGELVRASKGCYSASKLLDIPFASGKDSLNNCYYIKEDDTMKKVSIPGTLLITCVAPVGDVRKIVGSDFKKAGNLIYLIGGTYREMGGSVLIQVLGIEGGSAPGLNPNVSLKTLKKVQEAISRELLKSCHDLSDGGLAVAVSEMCFSGVGAKIDLSAIEDDKTVKAGGSLNDIHEGSMIKLFSESNSRFLVEVAEKERKDFEELMKGVPVFKIGETTPSDELLIKGNKGAVLMEEKIEDIKRIWKNSIKW